MTDLKPIHLMVDLETLGTSPNAAVVELGACIFEPGGEIIDTLTYCIEPEGDIDTATVFWWFEQISKGTCPPHLEPDFSEKVSVTYAHALGMLSLLWEKHKPEMVWSNPATFDTVILTQAYRNLNIKECPCPWDRYQVGDIKTLAWLCDRLGYEILRPEPDHKHSALSDCFAQVKWLCSMWEVLEVNLP